MPIGNLAGPNNEGNAGETQQLIEFVMDDASTIVQEDVDAQPSTPAQLSDITLSITMRRIAYIGWGAS